MKRRKKIAIIAAIIACVLGGIFAYLKFTESPPVNLPQAPQLVGANYYVWYDTKSPGGHWEEEVTDIPFLGEYDSDNPEVINQHIRWASEAGIDFFSVEWCGEPGSPTDEVFAQLMSLEEPGMKFCIFYDAALNLNSEHVYECPIDFEERYDPGLPLTKGEKFIADMDYLSGYFNSPNYLRLDDKPVVFFYPVAGWENAESYLEEYGTKEYNTYDVADVMGWDFSKDDWTNWQRCFEAITGGGLYSNDVLKGCSNQDEFLDKVAARVEYYHNESALHELDFIPSVMPGFDDRDPDNPPLERREGYTFSHYWDIACENLDGKHNIVMITTFNEWHEGTEIEPSSWATESPVGYGMFYLDLLKELRGEQ